MAVAKAKAVAIAIAKTKGHTVHPVCKNRRRVKAKPNRFTVLHTFLRNLVGEQVEIGTIAGVVVGTLTDVEVNYLQMVDNAGNLVLIPLRNIVYVERI